ncbi:MAG: hypothetical protein AB7E60_05530 [Sphingobium sp.]
MFWLLTAGALASAALAAGLGRAEDTAPPAGGAHAGKAQAG